MPNCLKLPHQCKIGILPKAQNELEQCIEEKGGYQENKLLKVEVTINTDNYQLKSIKQFSKYHGISIINILGTDIIKDDILYIDTTQYLQNDFEIIDLR